VSAPAIELRWALSRALRAQADAYVQAHPRACFAHDAAWRDVLWQCYRIPTPTLVALRAARVVGAAPLSLLVNPLVGPYAIVGPFASYADVLADDDATWCALVRRAAHDLGRLGVRHLRIRSTFAPSALGDVPERSAAGRFISPRVDLRDGVRTLWDRKLEVRARNAVRKAKKRGVVIERATELAEFMHVIDTGNRRLGSPFHGAAYFRALERRFGERVDLWIAKVDGKPAAVSLSLVHRDCLHYVYGQNVAELRPTAANALLVWHMIEDAGARGLSSVDLGRSEADSPHQSFKRQWGAIDVPLWDSCVAARGTTLPDLTPTNPEFSRVQAAWSRLPLWATKRLGPLLIRGFG
jgi:FemAB-related protein (PEP-CTERM system-associated)